MHVGHEGKHADVGRHHDRRLRPVIGGSRRDREATVSDRGGAHDPFGRRVGEAEADPHPVLGRLAVRRVVDLEDERRALRELLRVAVGIGHPRVSR
ncbi:MAG: hypothetical protein ACK559_17260, partial [bacterium]